MSENNAVVLTRATRNEWETYNIGNMRKLTKFLGHVRKMTWCEWVRLSSCVWCFFFFSLAKTYCAWFCHRVDLMTRFGWMLMGPDPSPIPHCPAQFFANVVDDFSDSIEKWIDNNKNRDNMNNKLHFFLQMHKVHHRMLQNILHFFHNCYFLFALMLAYGHIFFLYKTHYVFFSHKL